MTEQQPDAQALWRDTLGRAAWYGRADYEQRIAGVPVYPWDRVVDAKDLFLAIGAAVEAAVLARLQEHLDNCLLHLRETSPNHPSFWEGYMAATSDVARHMGVQGPQGPPHNAGRSITRSAHYNTMHTALQKVAALAAAGQFDEIAGVVALVQAQAPDAQPTGGLS